MGNGPFRERTFAPEEVRRLLRRASDLAEKDGRTAAGRPLTHAELVALGGDLGLPSSAIDTAIEGAITEAVAPAPHRL